jgi:hypothetical protein
MPNDIQTTLLAYFFQTAIYIMNLLPRRLRYEFARG